MTPDLGRGYDTAFSGVPPHMSALDLQIWSVVWPRLKPETAVVYFDVRLGPGRDAPDAMDATHRDMWRRLNQKRADVLIDRGRDWYLIELRSHAQLNAIGRLLGYQLLWLSDPPDHRPLSLGLYTDADDDDVRQLCQLHHITYSVI